MRAGALGCRHGAGERYAERRVAASSRGHHGPGPELKLPASAGERSAGDGVPRRLLRGDEFDSQLNAAVLFVLCLSPQCSVQLNAVVIELQSGAK